MENTFKATIKGNASEQVWTKSNGAEYVLIQCLITDGPLKGQLVSGTRTIKSKDGKTKSIPSIDDNITLYHRALPSTTGSGYKHFFEISTGVMSASDDTLTALLNGVSGNPMVSPATEEALQNQAIG